MKAQLSPSDRVIIYKIAPVVGYELPISNRLQLRTTFHPLLAYFPYSKLLSDTDNSFFWGSSIQLPKNIVLLTHPTNQNNGFHFLEKANASLSYKVSKNIAGTFSVAYQQGFSNILVDSTHIYMPEYPEYDNKMYCTNIKGSSWQFHFGLRWYLGQAEGLDDPKFRANKMRRSAARSFAKERAISRLHQDTSLI